ncbi:hypothetical protein BGX38DRAFT_1266202 [Terfezia claveryi]|nr:hypothetical protein BGX38DRAFT_1266202 [Terfezia claveryi]
MYGVAHQTQHRDRAAAHRHEELSPLEKTRQLRCARESTADPRDQWNQRLQRNTPPLDPTEPPPAVPPSPPSALAVTSTSSTARQLPEVDDLEDPEAEIFDSFIAPEGEEVVDNEEDLEERILATYESVLDEDSDDDKQPSSS